MITGLMFKNGIISAANNISNSRQAVDALNIFPVPDGDTGTNMSMTINAAAADIAAMPEDSSLGEVSKRTASALLRGARGNSGVILSLIFRGMSKAFKGLDEAGSKDVAKAFRMGCDAAYKAVMKPTEGTILTVIRKAAEAAEEIADIQDEPLKVCFAALQAAKQALAKTPEQLPVLKKAGVVDAGGQGLVLIFEGIQSVFENNAIVQPIDNEKKEEKQSDKSTVAAADEEIKFGYCSEFLIEKEKSAKEKDPLKLRAYLESIGDCVVVVDDNDIIKVHVHSNCPGDVIQSALKYGQLINIKIDNMRYVVVSGGQTMNPSTDNILNAINQTPAKTVFVLPNNKNIIMAAQQAVPLAKDRTVIVLQTKTIPQGISAMLSFDETQNAQANAEAMTEAAGAVETGQVTFAARDSEVDGKPIKQGQMMGMANGAIKFIGDDKEQIAFETAESMIDTSVHSLVTIIFGEGADENGAQAVEQKLGEKFGSDIEISIVDGGQPVYYYIISVE